MRYLDETNRLPVHYRSRIEERLEGVRRDLAAEFGCDAAELALTRNATEALHTAQCGLDLRPGDEVVTTDQDYPRMLWMWDQRARRDGVVIRRIQSRCRRRRPICWSGSSAPSRRVRACSSSAT